MAKQPRPRRQPQRTCIACQESSSKRELVRLVRTPEGRIEVDESGKRSGRGAYLCRQRACWETALQRQAIGRALKTQLLPEDRERIEAYAASLTE